MRKAGLVLGVSVSILISALAAPVPVFAAGPSAPGLSGRQPAKQEDGAAPVFTLALNRAPVPAAEASGLDLREPDGPLSIPIIPAVPGPALELDGEGHPLRLSVFLGRARDDIFSSLHEKYAWRLTFKSMTVGLGVYREFQLARGIGLQPYLGVIRSSATLRPSDLFVQGAVYEYRLTIFCVGLPLIIRFN